MNSFKKWTIAFFITTALLFLTVIGTVLFVDPYFQYHKPLPFFPYKIDNQLTQNPGLAREMNYDAIILGSSVTVNFDASWFNDDFGLTTLKLPYNGAYPKDFANILRQVEISDNDVKQVFWIMDIGSFSGDTDEIKFPIEENLYDKNPLNDISYLINKEIFYNYIIDPALSIRSTKTNVNDTYPYSTNKYLNYTLLDTYASHGFLTYNRDTALNNFISANPNIDMDKVLRIVDEHEDISILYPEKLTDENAFLDNCKKNMTTNILPYIENHPDTQFTIGFAPLSILNWTIYANNGSYDAIMKEYTYVAETLSQYDNVTVYSFLNADNIIYNLDLYTDAVHYNRDINHWMEQEFTNPESKYIIR